VAGAGLPSEDGEKTPSRVDDGSEGSKGPVADGPLTSCARGLTSGKVAKRIVRLSDLFGARPLRPSAFPRQRRDPMQTMRTVFNSYERVEAARRVVRRFGTLGAFITDRRATQ